MAHLDVIDRPATPRQFTQSGCNFSSQTLDRYLRKIHPIFPLRTLLSTAGSKSDIIDYYEQSFFAYSWFHSRHGSIHMALNPEGTFSPSGYHGQVEIVQHHIDEIRPKTVVELASGRGYNSISLARKNPQVFVTGLDLVLRHVIDARRRSLRIGNVVFIHGDFENLPFAESSVEFMFVVESLCHAISPTAALRSIGRTLTEGGTLVVIDGFRQPGFSELPPKVQVAARIAEQAMAVTSPMVIDDWVELATSAGFDIVGLDDLTAAIHPNLLRLQFLARGFFKWKVVARTLASVLPRRMTMNAVAGLLLPLTTQMKAQGYYSVTLRKKPNDA